MLNIMNKIRNIFTTNPHREEIRVRKQKVLHDNKKTGKKIDLMTEAVERNITVTHNIAVAIGAMPG